MIYGAEVFLPPYATRAWSNDHDHPRTVERLDIRSWTPPLPQLPRRPPRDALRLRLPRVRREPRHSRRRAHRSRGPDWRQQDRGQFLQQQAMAESPVVGARILDSEW